MNKAVELYSAVPKQHNCAQAVVCGCGHEELNELMQSCGAGKAPEGLCGALYSAMTLAPEKAGEILSEFIRINGSAKCAVLKKELHVPCLQCVKTGAELAEKVLKSVKN